jgi:hypothetical protein
MIWRKQLASSVFTEPAMSVRAIGPLALAGLLPLGAAHAAVGVVAGAEIGEGAEEAEAGGGMPSWPRRPSVPIAPPTSCWASGTLWVVVPWLVPEVSLPTWASGGQEALDLGKVLRRRALRGVGGVEPGRRWRARGSAPLQLVSQRGLVEAREGAGGGVARIIESAGGAERAGGIGVVLVGDEAALPLRKAARQRRVCQLNQTPSMSNVGLPQGDSIGQGLRCPPHLPIDQRI